MKRKTKHRLILYVGVLGVFGFVANVNPKPISTKTDTLKVSKEVNNIIYADTVIAQETVATVELAEVKDVLKLNTIEKVRNVDVEIEESEEDCEIQIMSIDYIDVEDEESIVYEGVKQASTEYEKQRKEEGKSKIEEQIKKEEEEKRKAEEARKKAEAERIAKEKAALEAKAEFSYHPYHKSGLTVDQYNRILKGTGLEGQGQAYYDMEHEYGVNGLFAVGVAFQESGYGYHRANTNNCYGMRNGSKGWMSFSSLYDNINYFGKLMQKKCYKGKTIDGISVVYCPPTAADWACKVKKMMNIAWDKR